MRVADKTTYDNVNRSIGKNRSDMTGLQQQAATQKRVTKPSDDPVAASRVLSGRVEQRSSEQFVKNLDYAKSFLNFSEQTLGELGEVLVRAKELAISQANDASANVQSRRAVAAEVNQLHNQAIQIGNRKLGERFIFAGYKTTQAPFTEEGDYRGDSGEMRIHIDKDAFLSMNVPGSMIFQGQGLSKDGFSNHAPKQSQTVEALMAQKAERPDAFHLDTDGEELKDEEKILPQHPQVDSRGPASVRVSEDAAPIEPQKVHIQGEKNLPDGVNVFNSLKKLEVALTTDDKMGVQESLDRLDDALQQVVMARTAIGSRVTAIDNTLNSMHTNIVDTKTNISQLEDADAFEVISDINKTESQLQATLQTSSKMMQKSLMDFIS